MRNERAQPAEGEAALRRLATKRARSARKRRWEIEDKTKLTVITVCAVIMAAHYVVLSVGVVVRWVGAWYDGLSLGDQTTARFGLTTIGVLAILCVAVLLVGAMHTWTKGKTERRKRDHSWAMGIWTRGRRG